MNSLFFVCCYDSLNYIKVELNVCCLNFLSNFDLLVDVRTVFDIYTILYFSRFRNNSGLNFFFFFLFVYLHTREMFTFCNEFFYFLLSLCNAM